MWVGAGLATSVLIIVGTSWWADIPFGALWARLSMISVVDLGLIICASGGTWALRAARLRVLFTSLSFAQTLYISSMHNALTRLLPARAGELSLPVLLKRDAQTPLAEGTLTMVWLRLIEVACLGSLTASAAMMTVMPEVVSPQVSVALAVMSLGAALSARPLLRSALLALGRYVDRVRPLTKSLNAQRQLSSLQVIMTIGLTCSIMLCQALLFSFILWSMDARISYVYALLGSMAVHLAGVLPAPTIGNVGTHEAGWMLIYVQLGVSAAAATASALISQWLTLALAMCWWGLSAIFIVREETKG